MKKAIYSIGASLVLLVLGTVVFLFSNFHTTVQGAINELNENTEGHIIQLSDDTLALIVSKDGNISVAYSSILYPSRLRKDFEVYPTDLSIYDLKGNEEILYTNSPKEEGLSFGLIKSKQVEYTMRKSDFSGEETLKVIPISDYLNDPKLREVKLWYSYSSFHQERLMNELLFLDKSKKTIPIKGKKIIQK